jgi:hypothetical protein
VWVDRSVHPPEVAEVEYLLDSADADDLIESFPAYLVSESLAARLAAIDGLRFERATVAPGDHYAELSGDAPHKAYVRLLVTHGPDAWLDDELRLCVSDRGDGRAARLRPPPLRRLQPRWLGAS